jgi:hypothetical protein
MGPTEQRISTSQSMLSSPKAAIRNNRPKFRFGPILLKNSVVCGT